MAFCIRAGINLIPAEASLLDDAWWRCGGKTEVIDRMRLVYKGRLG